jgi:O-antigen/teichoic acid export membrane protein
MAIMLGLAVLLPRFFPDIPPALQAEARIGLLWVGGSFALGLPFVAISGVFTGIQRNEVPGTIIVVSRLITAAALIGAAAAGHGLVAMAKVFALVNLLTYVAQWMALRWFVPALAVSHRKVSHESFRELVDYSTSLTVWSFAMLLVSGLDLVLVARFDFPAVGAFAIAAGLANLFQGAQGVVMNAFLPVAATLDANGDRAGLIRLLLTTTRWNLLSLGFVLGLYVLAGRLVLTAYIGPEYVTDVAAILSILLLAATIRLSMLPFNVVAIGTGDHRRIILSPIAEGICNLLASAFLGWRFGAIGVAWGTVVGGVVGVAFHLGLNLPRSVRLGVGLRTFASAAFLPAMIAVTPLLIVAALQGAGFIVSGSQAAIVVAGVVLAFVFLAWSVTLEAAERQSIVSKLTPR